MALGSGTYSIAPGLKEVSQLCTPILAAQSLSLSAIFSVFIAMTFFSFRPGDAVEGYALTETQSNAAVENSARKSSTADGQKNNAADLALTQQIRKSVMADKSLSTYAHNVKIASVNGEVTLNGVVRDLNEKNMVAMKAETVAGKDKVINALKIAPPK